MVLMIVLVVAALALFGLKKNPNRPLCPVKTYPALAWSSGDSIEDIKKIGPEYVELVVWIQILEDESLLITPDSYSGPNKKPLEEIRSQSNQTEQIVRQKIKDLKKNNFKVYLNLYPEWLYTHEKDYLLEDSDKYLIETKKIALDWAKIAEEEKVEIFSPLNEPFLHVGYEKTFVWHKDVLPELRKVYHGLLAPRGLQAYHFEPEIGLIERVDTQFDFSGWDLIAFDVYGRNTRNYDEFRQYLEAVIAKSLELKKKYNAKGIVFSEMGEPNVEPGTFGNAGPLEVAKKSWQIIYEESYGLIDYPFFWDFHGVPINEKEGVEIIDAGNVLANILKDLFSKNHSCSFASAALESPDFATNSGKIVFSDDFNNFKNWRKEAGDWQIKDGKVVTQGQGPNSLTLKNVSFKNGLIKIRFRSSAGSLDLNIRRTPQTPAGYLISLKPQRASVKKVSVDDKITALAEESFYFDPDWQEAIIEFRDNRLVVKLNSLGVFEVFDDEFKEGVISLSAHGPIEIDKFELED